MNIKKKKKKTEKRTLGKSFFPFLMGIFLLCIFAAVFLVGAWVLDVAKTVPEFDESSFKNQQTSYVYDNKGNMYSNLYIGENRTNVELQNMPDYLIDMLVATEDKRFYEHHGVDVHRIFGAMLANLKTMSFGEGASTLTMQVARNSILNNQEKELTRKVQEALLALKIEKNYSKDEILYFYLNEVYFGHGTNGVQAASQLYFGKDVGDISLSEAAMLVGILRNPSIYSPYIDYDKAISIRNLALDNLINYKPAYEEAALQAKTEELQIQSSSKDVIVYEYPWFTDYVLQEVKKIMSDLGYSATDLYGGGFSIYTTLDADIQTKMEELYKNPENFPESKSADIIESAMVVMDPHTGAIKGIIGGREHTDKLGFNRATSLQRQPGSTIKPLVVYTPALEAGYGPGSIVVDEETVFHIGRGQDWTPRNSNGKFNGPMTMRNAVKNSTNIPAVKFMEFVGVNTAWTFANEIGLNLENTDKVLALSLGGLTTGVSPLQMATAYSIYPSMGVYSGNYVIEKIVDASGAVIYQNQSERKAVISETTAYLTTDMLVTVTEHGTGTVARLDRPVASKTGTTSLPNTKDFKGKKGNRDAWFAAYTPELVGVVWMGYDNLYDKNGDPQYLPSVYGGKYPARLWKAVMEYALDGVLKTDFPDPGGWEYASVDKMTGLADGPTTPKDYIISEKFIKGTAPKIQSIYEDVNICNVSGLLASTVCSDYKTVKHCINNPLEVPKYDEEGKLIPIFPTETCTVCTQGITTGAYICTDPRHNGVLYLANIAEEGQEGGCPPEYVSFYYFTEGTMPTAYCNIAEHMLTGEQEVTPIEPWAPVEPGEKDQVYTPNQFTVKVEQHDAGIYADLKWNANGNDRENTLYAIIKITNAMSKETITTYSTTYEDNNIQLGNTYTYMIYATRPDLGKSSSYTAGVNINP